MKYLWFVFLVGCSIAPIHDEGIEKSEADFKSLLDPVDEKPVQKHQAPLKPPPVPTFFQRRLSVDFKPHMAASEILACILEKVGVPYALEEGLDGGVTYHAEARPFISILEDLCEALALRCSYDGSLLKIQKDRPYLKTYSLPCLTQSRTSTSKFSSNTSIFSTQDSVGHNGAQHTLETKATHDGWGDLEKTLKVVLPKGHPISLQRQAGLLHVRAPHRIHRCIEDWLASLRKTLHQQVLIEAKILEVSLEEEHGGGIDWGRFSGKFFKANLKGAHLLGGVNLLGSSLEGAGVDLSLGSKNFQALMTFMSSFGTVRTLSSPRLTVMHNQTAILKVAENQVFFDVSYERQFLGADKQTYGSVVATKSRIRTIPIGLVLSVHPSIHRETQQVTLTLHPTLSKIVGFREDPSIQIMADSLASTKVRSPIPVVAIREMDSVLKMRSGEVMVLGGLMTESAHHGSTGVPFLRKRGMGAKRSSHGMSELVIILRATLMNQQAVAGADRRLYEHFTKDPRPLWERSAS